MNNFIPTNPPVILSTPAPADAKVTLTDSSNVIKTFMELVKYTSPYGYEDNIYGDMLESLGFKMTADENYILTVGDGSSKTLFVAHLDTADRGQPKVVNAHINQDYWAVTDQTSVLGADDKAGVAILIYLISQNVPGDYLMVIGEEVGCVGSRKFAAELAPDKYDRAIEFDRFGMSEIITHQMGIRTASDEFALALSHQLNAASDGTISLSPSSYGVYTDTKEFVHAIPECTNIAVGYVQQHTVNEKQDMIYLNQLAKAAAKVKWDELPTKRPLHEFVWDDDDVWLDKEEIKFQNIYEMWGNVESAHWSMNEMVEWVQANPLMAAKFIVRSIEEDGMGSLEIVERVANI